jgi:hypothetical protein
MLGTVGGDWALPYDPPEYSCGCHADGPRPPLVAVHLHARGVWVGREATGGRSVATAGADERRAAITRLLADDRARFPHERDIVIVTDDGEPYGDLIAALDAASALGYDRPLVGGGPAHTR